MAPRRPSRSSAAPAVPAPRPRSRRRWLYAALAALALTATVIPAIPAAAGIGIEFVSVGGDGSGDLSVTVMSDYPLTDWTLQLSDGTNTYSTFDHFADFTDETPGPFVDDADSPQTYVLNASAAAADLAGIAPGTYTVTAEAATDTNGDTLAAPQVLADSFGYVAQPTVTISSSMSPAFDTTDPGQQVSITGQLGCLTMSCPIGGWPVSTPVTVTDQTNASHPAFTGATNDGAGDFTVTGVIGIPGDSYVASVAAQPGVSLAATSAATTDGAQYVTPTITATATPAAYGEQSITGTVQYEQSQTFNWIGVQAVVVTATAPGQTAVTSQPTTSDGGFTIVLPPVTGATQWELSTPADDVTSTPFATAAQYSVSANQLWPATMTGFYAQVNKDMQLTVGGCLATSVTPAPADDPAVEIQYGVSSTGPWRVLGTVPSKAMPGCTGVVFSGAGPAAAPNAYYRANFPGDNAYEAAISTSVLAALTQVRYYHFAVSPRTVAAGKKITVSGTLQYLSGTKWHAYARQSVLIAFSKHANNTIWYLDRSVKSGRNGTFRVTFADSVGTEYWSADFGGNSTHYIDWAPTEKVTVHGHVSTARRVGSGPPLIRLSRRADVAAGATWPFLMVAQPLLALLSV